MEANDVPRARRLPHAHKKVIESPVCGTLAGSAILRHAGARVRRVRTYGRKQRNLVHGRLASGEARHAAAEKLSFAQPLREKPARFDLTPRTRRRRKLRRSARGYARWRTRAAPPPP